MSRSDSDEASPEYSNFDCQHFAKLSLDRMLTLLKQDQLTDVVLIAGSERIPAHRLVLCAASDYFIAMFTNNLRETVEHEVVLQNVDPDSIRMLVQYCYTGEIDLQEETVELLLSTANLLQLPKVVEMCCKFLVDRLHPSNCIGICLFAENQGCMQLQTTSYSYILDHYMEVIQNQEFLLLPHEDVLKLLSSNELNVPSEEVIFHSLVTWLKFDFPAREAKIPELLSVVKLPLLNPQFIVDFVQRNELFRDDRQCQDLILEALNFHLLPERRLDYQSSRTKPRKSTVGSLFIVGGMDGYKGSTTIQKYDWRTNNWSHFVNMNGRRLQFGAAVIDNKLYVVGGRDGLKTLNTVEYFDLKTKEWLPAASMATHRHGLGVGVMEGPMYAVGGHDGWSYLNTVERWDPQSLHWSYIAPMTTQRSTAGIAVLNNKLFVVGGRDGSSCLRTMESYDPHTNKWTQCAPMSRRRGGVGVGVANGALFAVGGYDAPALNPSASRFDCVERYDPKTDTWTTVSSMSIKRDAIGVTLLGDRLFAIGGYDGQNYLTLVESYDPQTNEWEKVANLTQGRAGMCAVVIKETNN